MRLGQACIYIATILRIRRCKPSRERPTSRQFCFSCPSSPCGDDVPCVNGRSAGPPGTSRGAIVAVCASMRARPTTWDDGPIEALEASRLICVGVPHWRTRFLSSLSRGGGGLGRVPPPPPLTGYIHQLCSNHHRYGKKGRRPRRSFSESLLPYGEYANQTLGRPWRWGGPVGWCVVGRWQKWMRGHRRHVVQVFFSASSLLLLLLYDLWAVNCSSLLVAPCP